MGKKAKRNWRKADTADVEEAVEDERLVQKLKRPNPNTAPDGETLDDELFTVDTAGTGEGLCRKTRRQIAREKLFPPKEPRIGLTASEEMKVAKAEHTLSVREDAKQRPAPVVSKESDVFDLWAAPVPARKMEMADSMHAQGFSHIRHRKHVSSKTPKTLGQHIGRAPSVIPAHAGQSLNPELDAYEDLTFTAAARELAREREEEELNRKLKPMTMELRDVVPEEELAKMTPTEKAERYRSIVCKNTGGDGGKGDAEEGTVDGRGRMKSQAQVNKKKKQKKVDENESQKVAQRRMEKSVGEVGTMLKEMSQQDKDAKASREYSAKLQAEKQRLEETEGIIPARRRFGRNKFKENAIVVPDAQAAQQGIRGARLQGTSAIHERLSSIIRRGLLPAPPEATKGEAARRTARVKRNARMRTFVSPLLRDSGKQNKQSSSAPRKQGFK